PSVVVGAALGVGVPNNNPLTTAFWPPWFVTRNSTCPAILHTQYCPPPKPVIVLVSSTACEVASSTSIRCLRPRLSKSSRYKARSWASPSTVLTSIVKVVDEYQIDATRSVPTGFCSADTTLLEAAHVNDAWP